MVFSYEYGLFDGDALNSTAAEAYTKSIYCLIQLIGVVSVGICCFVYFIVSLLCTNIFLFAKSGF